VDIRLDPHAYDQAKIRQLQSDLWDCVDRLRSGTVDLPAASEVNFIIRQLDKIEDRPGTRGDLVIVCAWLYEGKLVIKTIFLQESWQVRDRSDRLGKVYCNLD